MPIKPTSEETEKDFISRCMSKEKTSFPDTGQRYAVCKSFWDKREFADEMFVLKPRKSENRGMYLTRCSKNTKMKSQYPNLKERMGFCLTSFNEYYKYWAKLEDFAEIPKDSALGECIAAQKAAGRDYRTAYAACTTKVVVTPGPVNLMEDDLIVEPVVFEGPVSIDFDDTLSTERGQDMAKKLLEQGVDLHIVTRRNKNENEDVERIADLVGIPKNKIHYTEGKLKWDTLQKLGVTKHIDNNPDEIDAIRKNTDIEAVKFSDIY